MSNLLQRLLLFSLGIPAIVAVVVLLPQAHHGAAVLMILVFTGGAGVELARILRDRGIETKVPVMAGLGFLPPLIAYFGTFMGNPTGLGALGLLALGVALLALVVFVPFAFVRTEDIPNVMGRAAAHGFALVYPGLFGAFVVLIASEPTWAMESLLCFAGLTLGNDSLAWLFGVTMGKRRGIVAVSPNKSVAGFVGGMIGSVGMAFAARALFPRAMPVPWYLMVALGLAVGAAVILGDLFESALKRSAGTKDSGTVVPGRGGFLDSFDSILFAAPVFYAASLLLGLFR